MPETFRGQIFSQHKPLKIGPVTSSADQVPRYGKLELTVEINATYENPFDPAELRLDAIFTSPSGQEQIVPGFFVVEHRREVHTGSEVLLPEGHGAWKIRFAPQETGRYSWRLSLRDRSGEISGGPGALQALPADRPGFVRVSRVDPHYFAFDNGRGYFPIGHNLPIYHTSGQLGDEAMRKFAGAKENFNRWWMSASGLGIKWMDRLGWYRQDAAARLDAVLDQAQQLGLYYMLCLDTHQDFREQRWPTSRGICRWEPLAGNRYPRPLRSSWTRAALPRRATWCSCRAIAGARPSTTNSWSNATVRLPTAGFRGNCSTAADTRI